MFLWFCCEKSFLYLFCRFFNIFFNFLSFNFYLTVNDFSCLNIFIGSNFYLHFFGNYNLLNFLMRNRLNFYGFSLICWLRLLSFLRFKRTRIFLLFFFFSNNIDSLIYIGISYRVIHICWLVLSCKNTIFYFWNEFRLNRLLFSLLARNCGDWNSFKFNSFFFLFNICFLFYFNSSLNCCSNCLRLFYLNRLRLLSLFDSLLSTNAWSSSMDLGMLRIIKNTIFFLVFFTIVYSILLLLLDFLLLNCIFLYWIALWLFFVRVFIFVLHFLKPRLNIKQQLFPP